MDTLDFSQDPWLMTLSLGMALAMGAWTYLDARELRERGAWVLPWFWALMVFLVCGFSLPLYFVLRLGFWRRQVDDAAGPSGRDDGWG